MSTEPLATCPGLPGRARDGVVVTDSASLSYHIPCRAGPGWGRGIVIRVQRSRSCHLGDGLKAGDTGGQQFADLPWMRRLGVQQRALGQVMAVDPGVNVRVWVQTLQRDEKLRK